MSLQRFVLTAVAITLGACSTDDSTNNPSGIGVDAGTMLVLTSDYETSGVDAFVTTNLEAKATNLAAFPGDTALRVLGDNVAILDRSLDASSLTLLGANLTVEAQIGMPNCGPHDIVKLPDGRYLVSCYSDAKMRVVSLDPTLVSDGPDLSAFTDGDEDGLPEMDQMLLVGNRVYVSIQNLFQWTPVRTGRIVALDASTLELIDMNATLAGVQALELAQNNPYTSIVLLDDGRLAVGCYGDQLTATTFGINVVSPLDGSAEVYISGEMLAGPPSFLERAADGSLVAIVAVPNNWTPDEMRVVLGDSTAVTTLYQSPGFTLSGLAVDAEGRIYVGNRSLDEEVAGIWRITATAGSAEGPIPTDLPPLELKLVP